MTPTKATTKNTPSATSVVAYKQVPQHVRLIDVNEHCKLHSETRTERRTFVNETAHGVRAAKPHAKSTPSHPVVELARQCPETPRPGPPALC